MGETPARKSVRIFISSPGDVQEERERARQVIESLRRRYARTLALKHIFWEDLPLQAEASFQQGIDLVLSADEGVDLAVFVLWARLGTPPGVTVRRADHSEYQSGTEREFDLMIEAREQSGRNAARRRPDILVYRRRDDNSFDERLRGKATADQEELIRQKSRVEDFLAREFNAADSGVNTRAYHVYESPAQFSRRLRTHLIELLDQLAGETGGAAVWDIETQGPPFVGLEAFQLRHADVFFGREEEVLEARRALSEQARNGCAFLLLSGASGSGKSSLAQAGVAPAIIENEVDDHVSGWRVATVTPSDLAPHPISALIARLSQDDVLPELRARAASEIVDLFSRNPTDACALILKPALAAGARGARLLLVVDQLEELFASAGIDARERGVFLAMLEAMARSGVVWIVATVRADFYQQVQGEPALVRMKAGLGQLDILPPSADALRRLVEGPAFAAGLRYETLPGDQSLSDLILRDAAAHPELLPLIEDLLRELYERRVDNQLTLAAYEQLGRSVEGALALRAERAFNALPEEAKASLGGVLQAVVTHGQNEFAAGAGDAAPGLQVGERVVRQWASLAAFADGGPARRLIDAFVRERLFTAGSHAEIGAGFTIAHESLLRIWPRAVDWAQDNRDFLRTRALAARRMKEGSPLLDGDPLLGAAKDHLARNRDGFPPDLRDYIDSNVAAAETARQRAATQRMRRRVWMGAGAAMALVAIMATVVGAALYTARSREHNALVGQLVAEADRSLSLHNYARAEIAAARALTIQDTRETRQLLVDARSGGVSFVGSSAEAEPNAAFSVFSNDGALCASVEREGESGFVISVRAAGARAELWRVALPASASVPDAIAISERSGRARQLAVSWHDGGGEGEGANHAALWRLEDEAAPGPMRELALAGDNAGRHAKRIPSMAFHPTAPWILTSGGDRKLVLWDYGPARPRLLWEREGAHETAVHGVAFNADGTLLASGGGDYRVKVWRTADMAPAPPAADAPATEDAEAPAPQERPAQVEPIFDLRGHADSVFAVAFSADGTRLASGGYDRVIRIWDLTLRDRQGQAPTIATLAGHQGTIYALDFSQDGRLLSSGAADGAVRVWDAAEGRVLVLVTPGDGLVRSVSLRHFEDDLHIGGENGWSLWSIRGRSVAASLRNGGATVQAIAFDPTGAWLAAGGDDGMVRVWDRTFHAPVVLDARSRDPNRPESINGVVFSADGRWLAAAGEGRRVHVWDRENDWRRVQPADAAALRHDGAVWGLCFDPRGRWLASSNTDGNKRIRRWRIDDWSLLDQSEELVDQVYSLACAAGGERIVTGDSRARVAVRETEHLAIVAQTVNVLHGEANVWSVAIADAPLSIISGNSDGRVYRWTPNDPAWTGATETKHWTSDEDARVNPTVNSVSYSSRHGWIAAGGDGGTVEIYDSNLRRIRGLPGDSSVWWVTFDAQGSRLAFGGIGRLLRVFDLDEVDRTMTSQAPQSLYEESQRLTGLAVDIREGRISIQRRAGTQE